MNYALLAAILATEFLSAATLASLTGLNPVKAGVIAVASLLLDILILLMIA